MGINYWEVIKLSILVNCSFSCSASSLICFSMSARHTGHLVRLILIEQSKHSRHMLCLQSGRVTGLETTLQQQMQVKVSTISSMKAFWFLNSFFINSVHFILFLLSSEIKSEMSDEILNFFAGDFLTGCRSLFTLSLDARRLFSLFASCSAAFSP